MAETGRKVEVRFGSFSCSIEGYDDPAERMREILMMVQQMIRETPALSDHGPSFGAGEVARIEALLDGRGEESIEHDGTTEDGTDRRDDGMPGDAAPGAEDAVTIADVAPGPEAGAAPAGSPEPAVVNIFAARASSAAVPPDFNIFAPAGSERNRAGLLLQRGGGDAEANARTGAGMRAAAGGRAISGS